jgi:hypothetical protein
MNQNQTPSILISHGTSFEAFGVFSRLDLGRRLGGEGRPETVAVITIDGSVADSLILAQNRHPSGNITDELLLEIGRFADRKLAEAMADPMSRHGAGILTVNSPGNSSCAEHPLALPAVPSAPGLGHAVILAARANMAA